jgi:hypothetical protein
LKLRVIQPVHWNGKLRQIGEIVEVERADFINVHGVFDPPRWAVVLRDVADHGRSEDPPPRPGMQLRFRRQAEPKREEETEEMA